MALSLGGFNGGIDFSDADSAQPRLGRDAEPTLELSVSYQPGVARVKVAGRLDATTAESFLALMGDLLLEGARHCVVDLADAVVDGGGSAALTLCQRRTGALGGTLHCVG